PAASQGPARQAGHRAAALSQDHPRPRLFLARPPRLSRGGAADHQRRFLEYETGLQHPARPRTNSPADRVWLGRRRVVGVRDGKARGAPRPPANIPGGERGMSSWTVLDLFSGAGGMSYGFHANPSFQLVGAVDAQVGKPSSGPGALGCNDTYEANIG